MILRLLLICSIGIMIFLWVIGSFSAKVDWRLSTGYNDISGEVPDFYFPPNDDYPKISWLGHGGVYIEWAGIRILLDPILNSRSVILPRLTPTFVNPEDLPRIDYVLLSHMHYDHFDRYTLENLVGLRNIVVPRNSEVFLGNFIRGRSSVISLSEDEEYERDGLRIISLRTLHNGSRFHPFSSDYRASAYLISYRGVSIYFSGDTGYGSQFRGVRDRYAPDISILPIGAFEPYFLLYKYHLSPEDAVRAGKELGSEYILPNHFGTFRMALDSPKKALPRFVTSAKERNINIKIMCPVLGACSK